MKNTVVGLFRADLKKMIILEITGNPLNIDDIKNFPSFKSLEFIKVEKSLNNSLPQNHLPSQFNLSQSPSSQFSPSQPSFAPSFNSSPHLSSTEQKRSLEASSEISPKKQRGRPTNKERQSKIEELTKNAKITIEKEKVVNSINEILLGFGELETIKGKAILNFFSGPREQKVLILNY